jgi:hypothetical protein
MHEREIEPEEREGLEAGFIKRREERQSMSVRGQQSQAD